MDINMSNEDLNIIIEKNNQDMQKIINSIDFDDLRYNDELKRIFMRNLELYKIAKSRNVQVDGYNFMMALSTSLGYNMDKDILAKKNRK